MVWIRRITILAVALAAVMPVAATAQTANTAVETQKIDGAPFAVIVSADSRHLYVTQGKRPNTGHSGVVAFAIDGTLKTEGFVPLDGMPTGAALSHDGRWLAVAAMSALYLIEVAEIPKGATAVKWKMDTDSSIGVTFSADDRFLFVPQEHDQRISVIPLGQTPSVRPDTPGIRSIPTGRGPVAVVVSPDGRYLYATNQVAPDNTDWPVTCASEGNTGDKSAVGAVLTIDIAKAETDPKHAVLSVAPAGCKPVRLALSEDGHTAYVTARKDNTVLIMDTAKLLTKPDQAQTAQIAVGEAPVGVAVDAKRHMLFVTQSDRFSNPPKASRVAVIALDGQPHLIGQIPAGVFPREVAVTPDKRWLFISNYLSAMVEKIDLDALGLN